MEQIKKIIDRELEKLNIDERQQFRGMVLNTFSVLYSDINNRMLNFENKILDSAISNEKSKSIINMIVPKEEFYLYEDKFSPVLENDKNQGNLLEILNTEDKIYKKLIYTGPYNIKSDLMTKEIFGELLLNGEKFTIKFRLEEDKKYKEEIKKLYKTFGLNSLKWDTLNTPYMYRMYKLKIVSYDDIIVQKLDLLNHESENVKIKIENFEYNKYFLDDYLVVWNVTKKVFFGNGIIEPTFDMIHYEHTLNFSELNDKYLVPLSDINIYSLERFSEGIRIETDTNKPVKWEFINITDASEIEYEKKLKYPVFSNLINAAFINKLRKTNDLRIRSIGELHRLIRNYKNIVERFELKEIKISEEILDYKETEDLNYFFIDEFKLKGQPKNLYLYFSLIKHDEYLEDELNFIISVLQLYFPEYLCRGVIVNE
ncbi:hypothetical protein [Fusobacterium sp. PH5-44]|uniref:hypothetical protein n=1 Tax=unclassified Fusobacterium TaxID=2648384 RepID=UPI003D1A160E